MCTSCCLRWRFWLRPLLILFYALFVVILVPLLIVNSVKDGFTKKDQLLVVGGLFVLTSIPISIWHILQHIIHFTRPILQKHIIRILWMVPIYALNAWFGLLFPAHSIYVDSIRECYEAYVIYNFMVYLLNYLNLAMDLEAMLELKPPVKHIFPLCFMQPWQMGREFVHNCKHGILQYTVVRPITTFISVICELCGVYGEGSFKGDLAFPYIIAINNISQFVAMYCLVLFYQANKIELKPMKPIPKFLCIKAVVFFSFFQGVIINVLVYFGYFINIFGSDEAEDYPRLASKLQNFLICIEMFLAAIAHHYSFPHEPFHINIPDYGPDGSWYNAFLSMLDITDVHQDVSEHIGVVGSSLSRRLRGRSMYHTPRGTTRESDYLIQPNTNSVPSFYQTDNNETVKTVRPKITSTSSNNKLLINKNNHYGAVENIQKKKNDGINIINQQKKEYSPKHGVPKRNINLLNYNALNTNSKSFNADNINNIDNNQSTETSATITSTSSGSSGIHVSDIKSSEDNDNIGYFKKSDSSTSEWLSTPTDEMSIDVKGIEKDRITYRDPNI